VVLPCAFREHRAHRGGQGLRAAYYNSTDLTWPAVHRVDSQLNFDWGVNAPIAGINADAFGVRWAGGLLVAAAGTYTLITTSDDGVRVWIDDTLVIHSGRQPATKLLIEEARVAVSTPTRKKSPRVSTLASVKSADGPPVVPTMRRNA